MAEEPVVRMGETQAGVTRPSVSPIYQTTAFDVPDPDVLQQLYAGQVTGDIYTRDSNPGMRALAQSIAAAGGNGSGGGVCIRYGSPWQYFSDAAVCG